MTNIEEIIITANRIANEGRKPSVALVKGRLTQATPLPVIISTLKTWQHQPDYVDGKGSNSIKDEKPKNKTSDAVTRQINEAVNEAIEPLKQEIKQLKIEIAKLQTK